MQRKKKTEQKIDKQECYPLLECYTFVVFIAIATIVLHGFAWMMVGYSSSVCECYKLKM